MEGRKTNVKYFHVFGNTLYILVEREYHIKWDAKSEKEFFLVLLKIAEHTEYSIIGPECLRKLSMWLCMILSRRTNEQMMMIN